MAISIEGEAMGMKENSLTVIGYTHMSRKPLKSSIPKKVFGLKAQYNFFQ